jgi:hypothetical protein
MKRRGSRCEVLLVTFGLVLLNACGQNRTTVAEGTGKSADATRLTPDARPQVAVSWIDATVPAGTEVSLELITALGSETTAAGSLFQARVAAPVQVGGLVIVPVGSTVEGFVREADPAARGGPEGGALIVGLRVLQTPVGTGGMIAARLTAVRRRAGEPVAIKPGATASESVRLSAGAAHRALTLEPGTGMTIVLEKSLDIKVKPQS